jgi:adenine-specific DNA-methyltransferase
LRNHTAVVSAASLPTVRSLGSLAEDPAEARKARGAFFTPEAICSFIAAWAIRSSEDRVLEPSCGEAAFLLSSGHRLQELGCRATAGQLHWFDQLHGVELHEDSAVQAAKLSAGVGIGSTIHVGDFFDYEGAEPFDAVIGNPPYVRYQDFTGAARVSGQARALAQGVRLSGLASSWAPFVVHAASFLAPGGRLGLVLPAELLSVNYAAAIRQFLLDRFGTVRLVMFEERVFPGVLEEVVLLLAEGVGPTDHFTVHQLTDLSDLARVDRFAAAWHPVTRTEKWVPALLPEPAADVYGSVLREQHFGPLQTWGETSLGMVTGNNKYFTMTAERAKELGLKNGDLLPISPPGSAHLRGVTFTSAAYEEMKQGGARCLLFYPQGPRLSAAARRYIDAGEEAGVQNAYKCRVRRPWWRVPLVDAPHLFLTYMNHDTPRLVRNAAKVPHLNSIHGVTLRSGRRQLGQDLLPLAALNSLTLLGAELVGRSYGGGMLKLEPTEADVLPVPSAELVSEAAPALRALRPSFGQMMRGRALSAAVDLVDRAVLIEALGLRREQIKALRTARELLFARRAARGVERGKG